MEGIILTAPVFQHVAHPLVLNMPLICSPKRGNTPSPKTGAAHFHVQLGFPDKVCEIKELVVCWMLLNLNLRKR